MHARKRFLRLGFGLLVLTAANAAVAQQVSTAIGLWNFTSYVDRLTLPFQVPGTVCIRPDGTYYDTNIHGLHGRWLQKGLDQGTTGRSNHVRLAGAIDGNNDVFNLDFVNVNRMVGTWGEWQDVSSFVFWGTVDFNRVASTCPPEPPLKISPEEAAAEARKRPAFQVNDTKDQP